MKAVMVTSHPIQYQVPVFRHLTIMEDLEFSVLFAMIPDAATQGSGFGVRFEWDVPLLEGYPYQVLENVAPAPSVTRFSGCDTPGVYAVLRSLQPDVVIVNGWVVKTCLQALIACKRLGIPCLVRGEANNLRKRPAWKRILQRLLISQYSACLYIGEENRRFYRSLGVNEEKLFSAPYCIDNERFHHTAKSYAGQRYSLRAKWNIPADSTCYLYCGKFEHKKHPIELLKAFQNACGGAANLHLLMVGDGELKAECEVLVAEHELPVTFTGFLNQSEIVEAYVAADCLVLPSDAGETWGLVVNEAMVCGLPAIVSDLAGCASDLVLSGKTGFAFSFGDWTRLSELMIDSGRDRAMLSRLGEDARRRIQSYSPSTAARGISRAVKTVVTR
jgi:glycosyltransferase involved in cell wall biosynthesis